MKIKYILWLLAGLFVFFSCSKTTQQTGVLDPEVNEEVIIDSAVVLQGVLLIDGSLNVLQEDGKMHWKAGINAGDTVGWTGEKMEAVRAYDGQTRTFYKVTANGEFWIQDYFIYGPAVPAVIVGAETVLYTRPDPSAVARSGTVTLPRYTLVALIQDDDPTDDFIPIAAFLGGARPDERYVRIKDISWDSNDVGGVKLIRIASVTRNPAARKELLKNGMEMMAKGSHFYNAPEFVHYDLALFELEVTNNLVLFNEWKEYTVSLDSVNIRDLPSIYGNVTGTLKHGDIIRADARSKNEITLETSAEGEEGLKGQWLRINEGNWVFSALVDPINES